MKEFRMFLYNGIFIFKVKFGKILKISFELYV